MPKKIYGLIGHPVEHSLSPVMQMSAFASLNIDAEYKLFDVAHEQLDSFLADMVKNNITGANVTIPHKIAAKEFIEKNGVLDEHAQKLGAVNTIKIEDDKLKGFNTDGPGFYRALVEDLEFEPEGRTIFVLGAGGVATAIIMYLGNGPKKFFVADIDECNVQELKKHFEKYYSWHKFEEVKNHKVQECLAESDLLIQATPIGMNEDDPSPIDPDFLHPGLKIFDLVYNQPSTKLVEEATKRKLHATTGLNMLLYQGAIAFELWTGKKAPVDVMRRALKEALK